MLTFPVKEEILVKLRSAEEETARRVAAAKARAQDVLKEARREAERILAEAEEQARSAEDHRLADERKRMEQERVRILAKGREREEALRSTYAKNVDAFVEKALATFERSA